VGVYGRLNAQARTTDEKEQLAREFAALEGHYWDRERGGLSGNVASVDPAREGASDPNNRTGLAKTESEQYHRDEYRRGWLALSAHQRVVVAIIVLEHYPLQSEWECERYSLESAGRQIGCKSKTRAIVRAQAVLRSAAEVLDELSSRKRKQS
jgi:hypothetical protein